MKKIILGSTLSGFIILLSLISCQKQLEADKNLVAPNLPTNSYKYTLPDVIESRLYGFIDPNSLVPNDNKITDAGATLGRVLFYDKKLSLNNSTSCGSCHIQEKGFSDGLKNSIGFDGGVTSRNTPAITNVLNQQGFFWDGRSTKLEDMVLMPIKNHVEMGIDKIVNLEKKIQDIPYYPALFESAFGSKEVTREKISKALSQFLRSMFSAGSKADNSDFTSLESRGNSLFHWLVRCSDCHTGGDLRTNKVANIGLDLEYADQGVGNGKFMVPSLRNVALTAPYMHDGRFQTLEEVVEHYNSGVQAHPSLDPSLRMGWNAESAPRKLNLSESDKQALVAYLKTLTDNKLVIDEKFSNPFVQK